VRVEEVVAEARALLSGEPLLLETEPFDEPFGKLRVPAQRPASSVEGLAAPTGEVGQGPEPVEGPREIL
jgi:hypothetical protein